MSRQRKLCPPLLVGVLALATAAFGIGWFLYTLCLQSQWKTDRLELTGSFAAASRTGAILSYQGQSLAADERILDYYFDILTFPGSMATGRCKAVDTERSICLSMPDVSLFFAPAAEENALLVFWRQGRQSCGYRLGGSMEFCHLERFFQNAAQTQTTQDNGI